jgi:ParB/RepB/Spo0J family partition protein
MMWQEQIEDKAISEISDKFSTLRIVNPRAELAMEKSLQKYGQVSPVICVRTEEGVELIDGFKRLRVCRKLGRSTLKTVYVETGVRVCKAAMIQLNRVSRSISDIEEAMVLQSLYREDGLTQVEIATLLSRDKSWVSRRISLIERLSEEVQQDIRLGLLTVSVGRELAKLPRGNQLEVVATIRKYRLRKRDVEKLVRHLMSTSGHNHSAILKNVWEVLQWEPPMPTGLKGNLIKLQRLCTAVGQGANSVSAGEIQELLSFIVAAMESAQQVADSLKRSVEVTI